MSGAETEAEAGPKAEEREDAVMNRQEVALFIVVFDNDLDRVAASLQEEIRKNAFYKKFFKSFDHKIIFYS